MSEMPSPERRGPAVAERELPVLVVGAARNGVDVDLIEVVLAGIFEHHAGLERVAPLHHGGGVGDGVNRAGGECRVRPAVDAGERVDVDRRDLVFDFLVLGEDVRVVDPGAAALVQAAFGEHVDEHLVERVRIGRTR